MDDSKGLVLAKQTICNPTSLKQASSSCFCALVGIDKRPGHSHSLFEERMSYIQHMSAIKSILHMSAIKRSLCGGLTPIRTANILVAHGFGANRCAATYLT
jgi:hypothetical protein